MREKILPKWMNSYVSRKDQQNFPPPILNLAGIPTAIAHVTSRTHIIIWISYDRFKYLASPSLYSFQIKFLPSPFLHSSSMVLFIVSPLPSQSQNFSAAPSLFSMRWSCLILLLNDVPVQGTAAAASPLSHFHHFLQAPGQLCECFMWLIYCGID